MSEFGLGNGGKWGEVLKEGVVKRVNEMVK